MELVGAGKGSVPRPVEGNTWRSNYDGINWKRKTCVWVYHNSHETWNTQCGKVVDDGNLADITHCFHCTGQIQFNT